MFPFRICAKSILLKVGTRQSECRSEPERIGDSYIQYVRNELPDDPSVHVWLLFGGSSLGARSRTGLKDADDP
jgi:hypothetical protein